MHQNRYTDFGVNLLSSSSAIDYKHKFRKKDEELSIDATYAYTNFDKKQNYITMESPDYLSPSVPNFGPIYENSPANGYNSTVNVWADYTDPLFTKNGKLGAGFKSQIYNYYSNNNPLIDSVGLYGPNNYETDYSLLSKYNYQQQIHAAYLNWNDQVGKFGYQVGLRVEDAIYNGSGELATSGVHDTSFHNSFFNFFPSAFISYQLNDKQSIYLTYTHRTSRPGFMQLLPFVDLSNPGTVSVGNPALIPEFIDNVELSYSRSDKRGDNLLASVYYNYTHNLIEKVTLDTGAAKYGAPASDLLAIPVNIASGTTYGVEGTGHVQIIKIWDATININLFENQLIAGNSLPELTNNSGFTWFGKVNTTLKLPKNFSIQVNGNYESPKIITQGTLRETYWVDVALKKSFWKNKGMLVLNCSDIFNTHTNYTTYNLTLLLRND